MPFVPVGPLHLGFTLPAFSRYKLKIEFLPLAIGSFIADMELLLMWPVTGDINEARGVMHSFIGAVTIDLVFTLLFAHFVASPLIQWVREKYPKDGYHLFAGVDTSERRMSKGAVVCSALLGTVSHVLIDLFSHEANPLFWPWDPTPNLNLMPFDKLPSSVLMHAIAAILLVWILKKHWRQ
jgi:membrane-bound metal-dependent hydrolase YbcI (DUF457 family)